MRKFFFSNDDKFLLSEERDKTGHHVRMLYESQGVYLASSIICGREVDLAEISKATFDFLRRGWNPKYSMTLTIDDGAN